MDLMGVTPELAAQIIEDELAIYKSTRFRLTTRLRILTRVKADKEQLDALTAELEKLEEVISEYEVLLQP